ncbi:hypothetical protein HNR23_002773 [Nocardiopsis mwathae]|uniref:Uncharacterized protein n=1 Tax=Nocardiopsis mwathae TaxID=1472723 RepID=A0A7X0D5X1_9ACTN|nr:hypothetical protein [Nocardiopsis mwathae]MBB6172713.1 hypothetical protein [Nocardiopsis mwathae]
MYKPVVVAFRRETGVDLEQQLERIMRPFVYDVGCAESEGDTRSRASRCDGWMIGGYWSGRYLSPAVHHQDLVNPLGLPKDSPLAGYAACDGGPKHLLDLERERAAALEEAWRRWPAFLAERRNVYGLRPPHRTGPSTTIRDAFQQQIAWRLGRAVTGTALVTQEGERHEAEGGVEAVGDYFRQAGEYIEALDDDTWLVCLAVHF